AAGRFRFALPPASAARASGPRSARAGAPGAGSIDRTTCALGRRARMTERSCTTVKTCAHTHDDAAAGPLPTGDDRAAGLARHAFSVLTALATLFLIFWGGLVTSYEAG